MPQLGSGIIPSGATATELTAITRRAFVPKMVVQIYNSTPLLAALIANANSASGGVSSVTVPVQGASFVGGQWSDYSGSFAQPASLNGAQNGEWNLKLMVVPVPFLGMEGIVQDAHAIIPLIEARMNDATNVQCDLMATALYNNVTDPQAFLGLPAAIDDGTNLVTYAGLPRTTNPWWKAKVKAMGSINPTRQTVLQNIAGVVQTSGEMPTFGMMGFGTWTLLSQDFQGQEVYNITPSSSFDMAESGPRSGFRALMVGGVPIYGDPYCPEGLLYLHNSNYGSLYIHEMAGFAFTGFHSTIPNYQIGFVGVVLTVAEFVYTKPKTGGRFTGYNSLSL